MEDAEDKSSHEPDKPSARGGIKKLWKRASSGLDGSKTRKESIDYGSIDPDLCVALFKRPSVKNYAGLKLKLMKADRAWLEGFFSCGGVPVMFDALAGLGDRAIASLTDAVLMLECISCFKALMRNTTGLDYLISRPNLSRNLILALDTGNVMVKKQVFEMLAAVCLYNNDGYDLALGSLDYYKCEKGQRYRFSIIVNEMKAAELIPYVTTCMSFINAVTIATSNFSDRVRIRNEFIGLGLLDLLTSLRHHDDDDLYVQISVFDEQKLQDDDDLVTDDGLDLNSHVDVFHALFDQVASKPCAGNLLSMIQSLLVMDHDSAVSDDVWNALEGIVKRAVLATTERDLKSVENFTVKQLDFSGPSSVDMATQTDQQEEQDKAKTTTAHTHKAPDAHHESSKAGTTLCDRCSNDVSLTVPIGTGTVVAGAPPPPPPPPPCAPPAPPPPPCAPPVPGAPPVPMAPPVPGAPPVPMAPPVPGAPPVPMAPPLPGAPPVPMAPPVPGAPPVPMAPPVPGAPPVHMAPPAPGAPPPPPGAPPALRAPGAPPPPPGAPPAPRAPGAPPPPGAPPAPGAPQAPAGSPAVTSMVTPPKVLPKSKMRKLNWGKIPDHKLRRTPTSVWGKVVDGIQPDYAAEELLFSQDVAKKEPTVEKKKKESDKITLFDSKRDLNVNIFLRQFKRPTDEIIAMMNNCDCKGLGVDRLKSLKKLLPDTNEVETLKCFGGDKTKLGGAEQFMLKLIGIKSYTLRVDGMILMEECSTIIADVRPNILVLKKSIEDLLSNELLPEILNLVLNVGNFMNHGSFAGNASGFTINTLMKLQDTRANKPRMNLLHFIAEVAETEKQHLLDFPTQVKDLAAACRFTVENLESEVNALKGSVSKLQSGLKKATDDVKKQFQAFLKTADEELKDLDREIARIRELSSDLAVYLCEDPSKFKLEEVLIIFRNFATNLVQAQKDNEQFKKQEIRRQEREKKKAADDAKRLSEGGTPGFKIKTRMPPQEEVCVIDTLMNEIKHGFPLRKNSLTGSSPSRATASKERQQRKLNFKQASGLAAMLLTGRTKKEVEAKGSPVVEEDALACDVATESEPAKVKDVIQEEGSPAAEEKGVTNGADVEKGPRGAMTDTDVRDTMGTEVEQRSKENSVNSKEETTSTNGAAIMVPPLSRDCSATTNDDDGLLLPGKTGKKLGVSIETTDAVLPLPERIVQRSSGEKSDPGPEPAPVVSVAALSDPDTTHGSTVPSSSQHVNALNGVDANQSASLNGDAMQESPPTAAAELRAEIATNDAAFEAKADKVAATTNTTIAANGAQCPPEPYSPIEEIMPDFSSTVASHTGTANSVTVDARPSHTPAGVDPERCDPTQGKTASGGGDIVETPPTGSATAGGAAKDKKAKKGHELTNADLS